MELMAVSKVAPGGFRVALLSSAVGAVQLIIKSTQLKMYTIKNH